MVSLHQHKRFTLTTEQAQSMAAMSQVAFDLELQILAQSHHYDSFPIIGVWDSLSGRPQMREWQAHQDAFLAEARAEFERVMRKEAA